MPKQNQNKTYVDTDPFEHRPRVENSINLSNYKTYSR